MEDKVEMKAPSLQDVSYSLVIVTILVLAMIYFEDIIKPVVVAMLIWFVIKELKNLMGRIKIRGKALPGVWRGIFSTLAFILIAFGIFELISINVKQMSEQAPEYGEKLNDIVNRISAVVNNPEILGYLKNAVAKINFAGIIGNFVNSLTSMVGNLVVIAVYVIFILMEEAVASSKMDAMFPVKGKSYENFIKMLGKIDNSVRAYMSSMISISLITAVVSYIALLILGVDFPILWAFLIFILNFIPYIGPFISSALPAVLSIIQFGDLIHFVYVFVTLEVIQVILGNFVQPKMMGKSMNISALTVLIALAFWGGVWGVEGMILAAPIAAIVIIILGQFPATRALAIMASENGDLGDD